MNEQTIYKPQTPMISGAGGEGFYPLTSADQVSIGDTKISKDNKYFNLDLIYPIGSVYQNIENIDVRAMLGGEWVSIGGSYERVLIDDLNIYPETYIGTAPSQTGWSDRNNLVCAYNKYLLKDLDYSIPVDCHLEFQFAVLFSTTGNIDLKFFLNNCSSYGGTTWSKTDYRMWQKSPYYRIDELQYEPVWYNSKKEVGIKLYYKTLNQTGSSIDFSFYGVHILMYSVSDQPIYKWKRVK